MKKLLRKLAVRFKLLFSFLLLAIIILLIGSLAIICQQSIKKNQSKTLASINLSDAFFEGKYFLRADMHIFTELEKSQNSKMLDYWWGEHEFQIIFFNDQIKKIENEFTAGKVFSEDTLKLQLFAITKEISTKYENELVPLFAKIKNLKNNELKLQIELESKLIGDIEKSEIKNRIESIHKAFKKLNVEITTHGLAIITLLDSGKDKVRVVVDAIEERGQHLLKRSFIQFFSFTTSGVLFAIFVAIYISLLITRPVKKILKHVNLLGKGQQPDNLQIILQDEFGAIQKSLNTLTQSLKDHSSFAKRIEEGNFDSDFKALSSDDILGNSLLHMRSSLVQARDEEKKRRKEDERRSWAANGIALFGELMRQSGKSLNNLSYELVSKLTDYIEATQGALFVLNETDEDEVYFEALATVAYDRKKILNKKIYLGEGLVGRTAFEKETIYLTDVPNNYVNITSGLGEANPSVLLLVPVKLDEKVIGVIELISFIEIEKYQIKFIEKIGESIASFISTIKTNEKTEQLLKESQLNSEELAAQEEEMRQNMEELQATQEEAARREQEQLQLWNSIGEFIGIIEADLNGIIISANKKACNLLNRQRQEIQSKNYIDLFFKPSDNINWQSLKTGNIIDKVAEWEDSGITLKHQISIVKSDSDENIKVVSIIEQQS